ncbi:alkaline phosphatase PhoX [Candidatus Entotheonella palauensis]|uniref:alkaline phosphatase PhoX n=1 Tax=Candidatus Entotheonella palauensis TaxID=93172 RepID=UPI000B801F16|nr:alkaline phosphatase PhoX [Candidatus Entotheonella palauensis]
MQEIEADASQSIIRVPSGNASSMFDMIAYDDTGRFLFIPHETPFGAGVSRHDIANRTTVVLFQGDRGGALDPPVWANDYGAFDPARYTPAGTLFLGEEWTAEGRIIEVMNPMAAPADIQIRELQSIANVAHEGINFSKQFDNTIYYIDEWNSGSLYKFVMTTPGDYTQGQTFVLAVTAFDGNAADLWNDPSNENAVRTGAATWVAITDASGNPLTAADPFRNGPTNDPRENADTRGGRVAADEVNGTPYGRPEDMVVTALANGNEVLYIAITSERTILSVEILDDVNVNVGILATADTPKNVGYPATTGVLNSPDNLALQANGNVYIIEDAPNNSDIGGDIWFVRDIDNDGIAESLDHFMSLQVDGAESTGMIFNPANANEFVVAVQHPDSTDLANVPEGFGDAVWMFDLTNVVPPPAAQ